MLESGHRPASCPIIEQLESAIAVGHPLEGFIMSSKQLLIWFGSVSAILVIAGVVFAFFGLKILPVDQETFLPWQSSLYGAIMMGWGTTLLCIGRIAFRRNDAELMMALVYGLIVWLIVEAVFSIHFRVWFNVGVDIAVLALFSTPLLMTIAQIKKQSAPVVRSKAD